MKLSTLNTRIAKSNNKNGLNPKNSDYEMAINVISGKNCYLVYSTGSGKWTNSSERKPERYLNVWGIDFEYGNDAPRGGRFGNFIQLSKKGLTQTKEYRLEFQRLFEIKKENERQILNAKIEAKKISATNILKFISENEKLVWDKLKELDELKKNEDKVNWQINANALVQTVSKNDFSLGWKEIYTLIKNY
jgi:hypothetical protein